MLVPDYVPPAREYDHMRIFVADARKDLRLALQMLLNQQPGMHVIGIAVRSDGLVEQVTVTKPDLLLVNWDLPGQNLAGKLAQLRLQISGLKIVVLSARPEAGTPAFAAGADEFVDMSMNPEDLLEKLLAFVDQGGQTSPLEASR